MVCSSEGLADQKTLKKVVKSVVEEEDRSRNVIIFGLPEEKEENVCDQVQDIFEEIGLKPTLQASRVGKTTEEKAKRPVKVSLSSASTVYQILSQARKLRHSAKFSKVFVRPDRSEEERASDRLLVQELSQRRKNEPNRLHYIRAGTVCSRDKGAD